MVGLETTFVFCNDCNALSTTLKSAAEDTALSARLVPPEFTREPRFSSVEAILLRLEPVSVVPFVCVALLDSSPVVPVLEVDDGTPLVDVTELALVDPLRCA